MGTVHTVAVHFRYDSYMRRLANEFLCRNPIVVYVNDSCSNYADMFGLCHTSLYHYYTNNKCTFRKAVDRAYRPTSYNGTTTINSVNRITKSQAGFWMPDTIRNSGIHVYLVSKVICHKMFSKEKQQPQHHHREQARLCSLIRSSVVRNQDPDYHPDRSEDILTSSLAHGFPSRNFRKKSILVTHTHAHRHKHRMTRSHNLLPYRKLYISILLWIVKR